MQASLADAFRASHYEVVATPGPGGVLRVAARISDLFINDRQALVVGESYVNPRCRTGDAVA